MILQGRVLEPRPVEYFQARETLPRSQRAIELTQCLTECTRLEVYQLLQKT